MRHGLNLLLSGWAVFAWANVSLAQDAPMPAGQAGMQINIDPNTGELLKQPAPHPIPRSAKTQTGAPLEIVDGPTPAHGQMINLKGRLGHEVAVQIGPDGKPSGNCQQKAD